MEVVVAIVCTAIVCVAYVIGKGFDVLRAQAEASVAKSLEEVAKTHKGEVRIDATVPR